MQASAVHQSRIAPGPKSASLVEALLVFACERDMPLVAMPRPEIQIVVRFGTTSRGGLDVHVLGTGQTARRKLIRRGQRSVTARLRLGAQDAVLGVPARDVAGRIVALDTLWGEAMTNRLCDRLSTADDLTDAASVLERAIAERVAITDRHHTPMLWVLDAAERLTSTHVNAVARDLGVSERHLRRVFHETVGVGPKAFAKLTRFHRALSAARQKGHASWAGIAVEAGYHDQAHLITEFRTITGVTPQVLLGELGAAPLFG